MQATFAFFVAHPNLAALALMVVATGLREVWDFRIRPLFVSQAEIRRMADELGSKHGADAEEIAAIEEDRAWCYANSYQQGVWRRVARELRWRSDAPNACRIQSTPPRGLP